MLILFGRPYKVPSQIIMHLTTFVMPREMLVFAYYLIGEYKTCVYASSWNSGQNYASQLIHHCQINNARSGDEHVK